jgi:hypothetical protein
MRTLLVGLVMGLSVGRAYADTTTITCVFSKYANAEGLQQYREPMTLTFIIDRETLKAYMLGNNGSSPVQMRSIHDGGFTFIETTGTGTVQVTAVDKKLVAVHSRHTKIAGELVPSQAYGRCTGR